jgi:tetratricopeptide (TPR) repeat protein
MFRKVLLLVLVLGVFIVQKSYASRRALVIGNDTYLSANHLANARNDARAIGDKLQSLGYVTTVGLDVNRDQMRSLVEKFSDQLERGDSVVFYYAGHGMQINGENILVPIDFSLTSAPDAKSQGLSLSDLLDEFISHGASTQIVILDACRDNPFAVGRSMKGGWAGFGTSAGTLLAFGTSPGATASDDPGKGHGLFTQMLLKNLDSPLDIERMLQLVRQDVIQASLGLQVPWVASSLVGTFHLRPESDQKSPILAVQQFEPDTIAKNPYARSIEDDRSLSTTSEANGTSNDALATNVRNLSSGGTESQANDLTEEGKRILLEEGLRLAREGNYDQAVRSIHAVLDADPRSSMALRVLGLVFHLMGRSETASATLTEALTADPQDARSLYYRCLVNAPSHPESAIRDCEASIGLNPNDAQAHAILADALLSFGDPDQALKEARIAINLDPNSPVAASVHGKVLRVLGKSGPAEEEFDRATKLSLE